MFQDAFSFGLSLSFFFVCLKLEWTWCRHPLQTDFEISSQGNGHKNIIHVLVSHLCQCHGCRHGSTGRDFPNLFYRAHALYKSPGQLCGLSSITSWARPRQRLQPKNSLFTWGETIVRSLQQFHLPNPLNFNPKTRSLANTQIIYPDQQLRLTSHNWRWRIYTCKH